MLQYIGKFLGPEEILEVKEVGNTNRDGVIVDVITKRQGSDGKIRKTNTTLKALDLVITDSEKDWNYIQDTKLESVVKQLIDTATDYGVRGGELQPMLARFGMALAVRFEHAAHLKFEGDDDEFVPGGSEFYTWSLAKAEQVIVNKNASSTKINS